MKRKLSAIVLSVIAVFILIIAAFVLITSAPSKKNHKPTIDIKGVPQTDVADGCSIILPDVNEEQPKGFLRISGREYELYCIIDDFHTVDAKGRNLREPVVGSIPDELRSDGVEAYTVLDWLYMYHAKIKDLPSADWLVSFIENRSKGELQPDNVKLIWKSKAVTDIPGWLCEFKQICDK